MICGAVAGYLSSVQSELGAGEGESSEVVLIKDRHLVGRRFCLGGFEGVWLVGDGYISIFGETGELIDTQPLEELVVPVRKAA